MTTNTDEKQPQRNGDGQARKATWTKASGPRQARATIIGAIVVIAIVLVGIGMFVSWGLAAIAAIIMIPGAISLAILARHPESTGGRSMLGISNPDTLLDPLRRPSERRGK